MTKWTFNLPGDTQPNRPVQTPVTPPQRPVATTQQLSNNGSAPASQQRPTQAPVHNLGLGLTNTRDNAQRLNEVLGLLQYVKGNDHSVAEVQRVAKDLLIELYEQFGAFNDQIINYTTKYIQPHTTTEPWDHVRHLISMVKRNPTLHEELLNCWLYSVLKKNFMPLLQAVSTISLVVSVLYA